MYFVHYACTSTHVTHLLIHNNIIVCHFVQGQPGGMRPSHAYQGSDDETSIPGGQSSPSPNPHGGQHC